MTNSGMIRTATDEQLADFLALLADCDECSSRYFSAPGKPCDNGYSCPGYWLNWLKEEA